MAFGVSSLKADAEQRPRQRNLKQVALARLMYGTPKVGVPDTS